MAYLLKGIESIDDELLHALKERGATFTELDLDWALVSETSSDDFLNHLYRPIEGKLNENIKIVTGEYAEIIKGLKKNYTDFIGHIVSDRVLILEDIAWEQKETSSVNSSWIVKLSKTPKMVQELTGWDYIIVTRKFWTDNMDRAQKAAMIFAELIRICKDDGSITKPTTGSCSLLTSTFGAGWLNKDVKLPDISVDRIEFVRLKKANGQITFAEIEGEVKNVEISTTDMPFDEEPLEYDEDDFDEMQEGEEE